MQIQKLVIATFFFYALYKFIGYILRTRGDIKVDATLLLLGAFNLISVIIAFMMQRNSIEIFKDFFVVTTAMLIYWLGRNYCTYDFNRTFSIMSKILLTAEIINVIFAYTLVGLGYDFYFSIGTIYVLFPFSFYLIRKNYLAATVAGITVLLGAKAGVIISLAVLLTIYLVKNFKMFFRKSGVFFIVIVIFSILILQEYSFRFSVLDKFLWKMEYYNPIGFITGERPYSELIDFGAGRVAEVYFSIVKSFEEQGLNFIFFGGGAGFTYVVEYMQYVAEVKNVHFSPVSLLTKYGLLAVILFYSKITSSLCFSYKNNELLVISYFLLGSLVYTLAAYTVFTNLLFWFLLGNLTRYKKVK